MTSTSSTVEAPGAERWSAPSLDGAGGSALLTAEKLEELQKQAYDEAFAAGLADGRKAGDEEVNRRIARLDALLNAMTRPLEALDEEVLQQLVGLAMATVKQLFRREVRAEPTHVIGVVREAVQLLPLASQNVRVRLHPDDAELVRDSLAQASEETQAWSIVEDPLIDRGGCTVTTESSQIDAQTQTRLQAVVASIAGDERQS
ncbi:MAG: flagellar assembly protein FliH [Pseudomonadota bacterium]